MPWLAKEPAPPPTQDIVSLALDNCTYDPHIPIYHDLDNLSRTISHAQAKIYVRQLVAGFRRAGLRKGDCFSITSFNDIMFSMLFLGGVGAGGVFSGMNPAYRAHEIRHHIRTAEVKFFVCEPEFLGPLVDVMRDEGLDVQGKLFVFDTRVEQKVPEGLRSWRWLLEQGSEEWERITDVILGMCFLVRQDRVRVRTLCA